MLTSARADSRLAWRTVKSFFRLIGILLAVYVVKCVLDGTVIVKSGPGARTLHRDTEPRQYWSGIIIYSLLALALLFIF